MVSIPCLHPLLAVLAEVRLVAQLWLRPGNANCGNNPTSFFLDLWENLPRHIRLSGVRADAALSLVSLTYNLIVLFERHLGWQQKVTLRSLRFWLFVTAGVLSHPAGKTTIKLAVPPRERDLWRRLWEKILSPIPNCNAVENYPVFSSQFA